LRRHHARGSIARLSRIHRVRAVPHLRPHSWLAAFPCVATACLAPAEPPRAEIIPGNAYIQVGDSFQFQLQVELGDPRAPQAPTDGARWWASDSTIAQIDSASGLV